MATEVPQVPAEVDSTDATAPSTPECSSVDVTPAASAPSSANETKPEAASGEETHAMSKAKQLVTKLSEFLDQNRPGEELTRLRSKIWEFFMPSRTDIGFLESAHFRNMVRVAMERCRKQPSKVPIHVREVIDSMIMNRPKNESERKIIEANKTRKLSTRTNEYVIERLYITLDTLGRKIRRGELQEESFNNDNQEPNYVYLDRLKKRAVEIFKKIQQLEGNKPNALAEYSRPIVVKSLIYPEINRALSKMTNRCLKKGFSPDYEDVLTVVRRINDQDDLGMNEEKRKSIAQQVFVDILSSIKKRRMKFTQMNMESLVIETSSIGTDPVDPADYDPILSMQLQNSIKQGKERLNAFIEGFTDRQMKPAENAEEDNNSLKLEIDSDKSDEIDDGEEADEEDSDHDTDIEPDYLNSASSDENDEPEVEITDDVMRTFGEDSAREGASNDENSVATYASPVDDAYDSYDAPVKKSMKRSNVFDDCERGSSKHLVIEVSDSDDEPLPSSTEVARKLQCFGPPVASTEQRSQSESPEPPPVKAPRRILLQTNSKVNDLEIIEISD